MNLDPIALTSINKALREIALSPAIPQPSGEEQIQDHAALWSMLLDALQLLNHYEFKGQKISKEHTDITKLGDYVLMLLSDLTTYANSVGQTALGQALGVQSFRLAVWIGRYGGRLTRLEGIVNGLAQLANSLREPSELTRLYALTIEVQNAVDPALQRDAENKDPNRPWRILLLNQAIIATRTHLIPLITEAYDQLSQKLPGDAPQFFRQGMEQMDRIGYPQHVREVVQHYHDLWNGNCTLH